MLLLWGAFGEDWEINPKITFDGVNRKIIIAPGIKEINVKTDLYSAFKRQWLIRDFSKFFPPFRTIGGDPAPLGSGQFAGDIYFLINGWQIEVNENGVNFTGIIFHDDGIPVFSNLSATLLVSNLAFSVAPSQEVIEEVNAPLLANQTTMLANQASIESKIDNQDIVLAAIEADIQLVRAVTAGRAVVSPDDLTITVYDTDQLTVLATYSVSEDGRTRTRLT